MSTNPDVYEHGGKRPNNPTLEIVQTADSERRKPRQHSKDVRDERPAEPRLRWQRARETKTTTAPMLMRAEQIDPEAWVDTLRKAPAHDDLFASFNEYRHAGRAQLEWYEHAGNWSNRLIHADARRAMASLLEHEHLGGAVQMLYFDPPYGMDFDARYGNDTIQRRAFVDTYEKGIHSYLDGIRETALLARELLTESGSIFMQIGDVNVHRCAMVLDEVFGPENRVTTITFATTRGGSSTQAISKAVDYILWYAKNRDEMPSAFQQLYEEQDIEAWCDGQAFAGGGDFPDGTRRALRTEERRDPKRSLPEGTTLWRMGGLLSQGPSAGEQGQPFIYKGTQFGPRKLENNQWRVDRRGLEALAAMDRLWTNVEPGTKVANATQLQVRILRSEMPGRRLTNLWDTVIAPRNRRYPVQTGELAIQRCMLMTTRPGDLVLDPTCGSGTTPVVAETWGRRWIAIDSSRESLAVARERILMREYPAHLLISSLAGFAKENEMRQVAGQEPLTEKPTAGERDPAGGIVVERMPYVSAATLAYRDRPDKRSKRRTTWFVDRPVGGNDGGRIASRFTVETEHLEQYRGPDELLSPREQSRHVDWHDRILRMLDEKGIGSNEGTRWTVEAIENIADGQSAKRPGAISHRCRLIDHATGARKDGVIAIWPQDAQVGVHNIQRNVREAISRHHTGNDRDLALIVIGAEIEGGSHQSLDGGEWQIPVARIEAGAELHLRETRRKASDTESALILVAEPTVEIESVDGQHRVVIRGWHEFNPVTGEADFIPADHVRMWMLDTDYNGTEFCARRIHLNAKLRSVENRKTLEKILGRDRDTEAVQAVFGTRSEPFQTPSDGDIAIRMIIGNGSVLSWHGPV